METVEAKLEVNVAKSVDTSFSQETGDRFVSPAPLFKLCLAFLRPLHAFWYPIFRQAKKTQREISDRLDELSRCYARHIVYIATTMDGKDRNFSVFFEV